MSIVTTTDVVSYLRDPQATDQSVSLVTDLANGLIEDEFTGSLPDEIPTWLKILALDLAEAGWTKFNEESIDDWSGKRTNTLLSAMELSDADKNRIAKLDGRTDLRATGYTVAMTAPQDIP